MNSLENSAASLELSTPPLEPWQSCLEQAHGEVVPEGKRPKRGHRTVMSSTDEHTITLSFPRSSSNKIAKKAEETDTSIRIKIPVSYPAYGEEHDDDVRYNGDSSVEEGNQYGIRKGQVLSDCGTQQDVKAQHNDKEEAEPIQAACTDAGTMTVSKAVLTQLDVLHLAASKQIRIKNTPLDHEPQQAGYEEKIYS
jgi:hypothetical protein